MILSTLENMTWSSGASERSVLVNASSSLASATSPSALGLPSCLTASLTLSSDDEIMVT